MSAHLFRVTVHAVPGQHVREWPRATNGDQNAVLRISVKQYAPIRDQEPGDGALTIIGAHANGFPKELYEPLWDELLERSRGKFEIRAIWITDVAQQGASYAMNEDQLANDPSWFDGSRDVLHVINHFRAEMPRPLVGIGHSFGACQLVNLALFHPRLFSGLILLDPVIESDLSTAEPNGGGSRYGVVYQSSFRRDLWPSRDAARRAFAKNRFYQAWDPRAFERWMEYGLRNLPTAIYPDIQEARNLLAAEARKKGTTLAASSGPPVTLTTTKHQEVFTYVRPNYDGMDPATGMLRFNLSTHPDTNSSLPHDFPFYQPASRSVFQQLPHLRPPVFYILGGTSTTTLPEHRRDKVRLTGIAPGGNGGLAVAEAAERDEGVVGGAGTRDVVLEGVGHLVPMEATAHTAELAVGWLRPVSERFQREEREYREMMRGRTARENLTMDPKWKYWIGFSADDKAKL